MNIDEEIAALRKRYAPSELERVEECLAVLAGRKKPTYSHEDQESSRIFFPGLLAKPWHDSETFAWVPDVEAQFTAVKTEIDELRNANAAFSPYEDRFTGDLGWPGWDTWQIYSRGEFRAAALAACPATVRAIQSSPHGIRESMFAKLAPGAHVQPHTGGVNLVLTVHLPLVVPAGCAIRVGGETRSWEPGRVLVFDDSFIHETWNRGDSERFILIWDIWHPDLAACEREALSYLFPRIEQYLTAR